MYFSAPNWTGGAYSADRRHKWAAASVHAEDNLGGMYLSQFGGSTAHGGLVTDVMTAVSWTSH
jgi:hypothetical protein